MGAGTLEWVSGSRNELFCDALYQRCMAGKIFELTEADARKKLEKVFRFLELQTNSRYRNLLKGFTDNDCFRQFAQFSYA